MKSKTFHRLIFAEIEFSKTFKCSVYASPSNSIIFPKICNFALRILITCLFEISNILSGAMNISILHLALKKIHFGKFGLYLFSVDKNIAIKLIGVTLCFLVKMLSLMISELFKHCR